MQRHYERWRHSQVKLLASKVSDAILQAVIKKTIPIKTSGKSDWSIKTSTAGKHSTCPKKNIFFYAKITRLLRKVRGPHHILALAQGG